MTRTIRYQQIAADLRARVAGLGGGRLLPSESDLSAEFAASRVTVRRALELLRDEGLVESRQGFGWIVAGEPLRQQLSELVDHRRRAGGEGPRAVAAEILEFAFETAAKRVRAILGTDQVLRVRRLNLADGAPFAVVTVWCPAELGQHLSRRAVEHRPFYELLGIRLRGATQTIGADAAAGRRRRTARRAGGFAGVALPADHDRHHRPARAAQRAPVPGTPHRVRRRAAAGRPVDHPVRAAPRGVGHRTAILSSSDSMSAVSDFERPAGQPPPPPPPPWGGTSVGGPPVPSYASPPPPPCTARRRRARPDTDRFPPATSATARSAVRSRRRQACAPPTIVLFWVQTALTLLLGLVAYNRGEVAQGFDDGTKSLAELQSADDAVGGVFVFIILVAIALIVVLCIWAHHTVRNAKLRDPSLNVSPGMAAGGWYIPVGNFWLPWMHLRRSVRRFGGQVGATRGVAGADDRRHGVLVHRPAHGQRVRRRRTTSTTWSTWPTGRACSSCCRAWCTSPPRSQR